MLRGPGSSWIDRVMLGLLGLFILATLGPAMVGAVTLLDVNLLTQYQPFQGVSGLNIATTNICRSDTVDAVMPAIEQIRTGLFHGTFPAWSSSAVGGAPLASVPNVGQFSPLSLPYYLFPLWLAPAFVKLAEFGVAIGGMVAFLRRLRLSVAAGVLAGIVFASSGFMLSWTNWPQTRVAALIPALFWATERLVQRHRAVDAVPLAVIVACMLLGGFPAVTGFALYCAGCYFLVRIFVVHGSRWRTSLSATLIAGVGLTLGGALSAFQLVPFARQLTTINLDYRGQTSNDHLTLSSLITTMVPDAQGLCIDGVSMGRDNPIESVSFIGVAAIVLAVVAIMLRVRRAPREQRGVVGFLGVAVVVVVTLGWLGGPPLALAQHFPVFSNNVVYRINSLLGFLVAVLAGFGFDRLLSFVRDRADRDDSEHEKGDGLADGRLRFGLLRRLPWWPVLVLATVASFAALVLVAAVSEAKATKVVRHLAHQTATPAILLVLVVALVVVALTRAGWARVAAIVGISLIVVGQSASAFRASVPGSDPANFYPVTPTHAFLLGHVGLERFAASGGMMYPATGKYYGLRTPTGHEFTVDAWKALLHGVDPSSQITASFSTFNDDVVNANTVGRIPMLDQLSVKYFVAPDSEIAGTPVPAVSATGDTVTRAPGQLARCPLPAGPLRAVTISFAGPLVGSAGAGATVHVRVKTPTGEITGARSLDKGLTDPSPISVAVPGEDLPATLAAAADVWVTGASAPFELEGSVGIPSCGTVRPTADGLKLVASNPGAIVYERLTSLPRFRWASTSRVQPDPTARVAELTAGIGPSTVLLDTVAPEADHKPATVTVTSGDGDRLVAMVNATGAGYLVVADSVQQPGWTAAIDGTSTPLVPANNAMGAIRIPAGSHEVVLTYTAPGQRTGLLISGASLLAIGLILVLWRRGRWAQQR